MKLFNRILKYSVAFLAASVFYGCQEEAPERPDALLASSRLTFDATGAGSQFLTVASNSDWMLDVNSDWISVSQVSGRNTAEVEVSVSDNKTGDVIGAPREGVITIITNSGSVKAETVVYQNGDAYYGVENMNLSDVAGLKDGEFAKVANLQVLAAGDGGFVAKDDKAAFYFTYDKAAGEARAVVGQTLNIGGEKTTLYSLPSIKVGQIDVVSDGEVTYPAPADLAAGIVAGAVSSVAYVSTSAGLLGSNLSYETPLPGGVTASLVGAASDIDLAAVNMHNIAIEAYYIGKDGTDLKLLVTRCEDKGINETLNAYFYDDFSWMKPLIDASGVKVGDSVGENNASADAPNLRTSTPLDPLLQEFLKRGYEDLNQTAKVIYPQAYYWKFGKTSNHGGIKLPKMEFEGGEQINVFLDFDWAAHMTGSGNIDKVQIVAEIVEGPGLFDNGTSVSDPQYTTQEKGHIEWQHVQLEIKGVNNETRIVLRPDKFAEAEPDQQRWHLDNIKIKNTGVPYADPVYANLSLSDEVITFEGTPTGPVTLKITSDNPWTITAAPGNEWFSFDVMEGAANEEVTVTVICQPSSSVNLRHGYVTLSSADTRKNIHVVQSAAGGELDPLIALTRNSITVLGEGEAFTADVQANVEYSVEIQDEWITEAAGLSTKAIVEKKSHSFTAATNMTGAPRTGHIRFYNDEYGIESVLNVRQENFEPRVDLEASWTYLGVSGAGCVVNYNVDSNIPYTITSDVSWVKLPASDGVAGKYQVPVTFDANTGTAVRTAVVTIRNEEYDYTKKLEINQFGAGLVFFDDFEWLAPVVEQTKAATPGEYDTVGSHDLKAKAPNIYTTAALKSVIIPELTSIGYFIPGKDAGAYNVLYLQENYLKMGKTGSESQTSLTFPGFYPAGKDVTVSFDWCRMEQGDGAIDNYTITLMIEGNGAFENGTKYSDELSTPQQAKEMFWTNVSAKITGADETTRITIVATNLLDKSTGKIDYTKSGGRRMFIDNIKVQ